MHCNGVPIPTILKVGEIRRFNDMSGLYIGVLTQERLDVYLRGMSTYHPEMPTTDDLKKWNEWKKNNHDKDLMTSK